PNDCVSGKPLLLKVVRRGRRKTTKDAGWRRLILPLALKTLLELWDRGMAKKSRASSKDCWRGASGSGEERGGCAQRKSSLREWHGESGYGEDWRMVLSFGDERMLKFEPPRPTTSGVHGP